MVETASRTALENALTLYAPHERQTAARAFVDALAVDELLFLAEFLGGCILATSSEVHQYYRTLDGMNARRRKDMDHKLILLTEFAERCGLAIKLY